MPGILALTKNIPCGIIDVKQEEKKDMKTILQAELEARGAPATQEEIAARTGLSQAAVSRHLSGARTLDFAAAQAYWQAFGVPLTQIVNHNSQVEKARAKREQR